MKADKLPRILWIEALGFSLIILLSWVNELLELPRRLFGPPGVPDWHEALLETVVVLVVWLGVHLTTRRVLKRLRYLEEFLRICAWCRKIGHEGEWLPLEEYLRREFDTKATHGVCPECSQRLREEIRGLGGEAEAKGQNDHR